MISHDDAQEEQMIFFSIGIGFALFWPLALVWQAWRIRQQAVLIPRSPALQEILDTLSGSRRPVSLWLSSAVSIRNGGITLLDGRIVLPSDPSPLQPFLGGIIAHEWAHRMQRHHIITIVYMTFWGLTIGTLGWLLDADQHFLWKIFLSVILLGAGLSMFSLSRYLEFAADTYVARHYPQWVPELLQYFETLPDKLKSFFDTHPQPSRRIRVLRRLMP